MLSADLIHHLLEQYGYLVLFLVVIVEGPIATIIGAFVASQGYFDIYVVYAIAVVGDLFGDLAYYGIGRLGRVGTPARIWPLLGITEDRLARAARYFERHGAKMLLFAKYTQTGIVILPASGAARMPVGKFLWYNVLGTIPKALALLLVGYFFGYAYNSIDNDLTRASFLLVGILFLTALYLLGRRYFRVRYDNC
ncbi:MAG: DedA family protein [Alphaproteobacteria bacterium]|nr:DedA family protein [Alphaproteobacteria bacterium]